METTALPQPDESPKAVLDSYYRTLAAFGNRLEGAPAQTWPIERAVAEGYARVVWVFKAVDTIAGNAARLKFQLRDGEDVVDDHPLYRLLNDGKANPLETGWMFRKRLSAQVLLSPRGAFVQVTRSRLGTPTRLDLLPPGRTVPVAGSGNNLLSHFEVTDVRTGRRIAIDPENVRWIRDPDPIDPYAAVTPLQSMGMSIELDHFARLYNVAFMKNDGRPGGVLGVAGDMEDSAMDRIEAKFGRGPAETGKLTVLAGEVSYVDTSARPRDMQYGQTSTTAKIEILGGFGVPESQLGNASGRTFDNAEAESYIYWERTMLPHCKLVASGFDEDSEEEFKGELDTSTIEVLELPKRQRRAEARLEVEGGLRSPFSYAQVAGIEEVEDTPDTRALYLPSGKQKIASTEKDYNDEQKKAEEEAKAQAEAAAAQAEALQQGNPAAGNPPPGNRRPGGLPQEKDPAAGRQPAAGPPAGRPFVSGQKAAPKLRLIETKDEPLQAEVTPPRLTTPDAPSPNPIRDNAEAALAAALTAVAVRRTEVTVARLQSPKQRKGTRHWVAETKADTRGGTAGLDVEKVVDAAAWAAEVRAAAEPIVTTAAEDAAAALAAEAPEAPPEGSPQVWAAVAVTTVLAFLSAQATAHALQLAARLGDADAAGADMDSLIALVRGSATSATRWAKTAAIQAATAAVEGARSSVADAAARFGVTREWVSRTDGKVRPSHMAANGQRQSPGVPFEVGDSLLRYPGDPAGPVRETAGCRCRVAYRWRNVALPLRRTS
jgi:HK97 family phage portal protein